MVTPAKADYISKNCDGCELLKQARKAFETQERANAERTWKQIAEFILPSQNSQFFRNTAKGIRTDKRLFESTAIQSNRDLSSAMQSTITNPSMKWSKLRYKEEKFNDDDQASSWLLDTTNTIHNTLGESNFDSQMGRCYQAYCSLGQMILFHEDLMDGTHFKGWNFYAWHLAEVAWAENHLGVVDTIFRRFRLSGKKAIEKFGVNLGEELLKFAIKNPFVDLDFYHCIYPRDVLNVKYNNLGLALPHERPFASVYISEKHMKVVKEDGYYEFPVYVARWSCLPGEEYGYGPGQTCLADVRSLNKIMEELLKALAKAVNPPIFTTKQNMMSGDMRPGGVTYVRDIQQVKEFVTQTRFDVTFQEVEALKNTIKSTFYIDKLLLPPRTETGEMSAYEVQQRLAQMQQILGPVLSRLDAEFLTPFIMHCLNSLNRAGKLKPLPPTVLSQLPKYHQGKVKGSKGLDFEIMFVNSLARSQQLGELQNVQTFVQEVAQMAQVNPAVLDNINFDEVAHYGARIRNIPETMIVASDQVKQIRDQRQKQQQAAAALQAGEQASNIAGNLSKTQPKGNAGT